MSDYIQLRLKPGKDKSILRFHPWIFSGALTEDIREFKEGNIAEIVDINGKYLGIGYIQHGSIAVRILSFEKTKIDKTFWVERFTNALNKRSTAGLPDITSTNCYRLIHAEGDDIPGLIVDIYNTTAVIQCHTSGLHQRIEEISTALKEVISGLESIYDKSKETIHSKSSAIQNQLLLGENKSGIVLENGHKFMVDWSVGQKTGFFLDQRENRKLLSQYVKSKTVLNTFSYTGGFSVYAALAGAERVDSVDISATAIEMLNKNMELNGVEKDRHRSFVSDTFQFMKDHDDDYDVIILDPPAFAKNIGARKNAIRAYIRLNAEGMKRLKPGGVLFTFSCSQVIDTETFLQIIYSASLETGIHFRILHRLTQGPDHPVNIFHPEGEYLKGLVLVKG